MIFKRLLGLIILIGMLAACAPMPQSASDQPEMDAKPLSEPVLEDDAIPQTTPSVDPTPVWSLVEHSIDEESDHPPYVIDAHWPNLEGDRAVSAVFNVEIDRRVNAAVSSFLEAVPKPDDSLGTPPKSYLSLNYALTLNEGGLVSVYLMLDTYIAISAHPFPSSQSLNFDLDQGRFLTLADLFAGYVDPLAVILERVEPDLLARDLGFSTGLAEGVLVAREHWNLLPEGLRINFDVYEVGPYAAGHQYVLIPWDDLAPYLNADGPVSPLFSDE